MGYKNLTWKGSVDSIVARGHVDEGVVGLIEPRQGFDTTRVSIALDRCGELNIPINTYVPDSYIGKKVTFTQSLQTADDGSKTVSQELTGENIEPISTTVKYRIN